MIARGHQHRHAAGLQGALYQLHRLPGGRSVKNIPRQQHQIALLPAAQIRNFSRDFLLFLFQLFPLLSGESGEGGIQMPIGSV